MTQTSTASGSTYLSRARWWVGGLGMVAALLAAMSTFNVYAGHDGHRGDKHGHMAAAWGMGGVWLPLAGKHAERFYKRLDVTEAQKAQLQALTKSHHDDMRKSKEAHQALHQDMKTLMRQPTMDEAALQALRARMLAHQQDMAAKRWDLGVSLARVLTPEQRQQLSDMMDKREARAHRHMKHAGMDNHMSHHGLPQATQGVASQAQ